MAEDGVDAIKKCGSCRKRRVQCLGGCESFPGVPQKAARVLRHSFGIRRLYNYQNEINAYLSPSFASTRGFGAHTSDLCVYVPTGYGKTLSYVLPILKYFEDASQVHLQQGVHALLLAPTQELVLQIFYNFKPFVEVENPSLSVCHLAGELNTDQERRLLHGFLEDDKVINRSHVGRAHGVKGPHVIICLASRLADHVAPIAREGTLCDFSPLRFVVVDEADRLLAQSYGSWLTALRQLTVDKDNRRAARMPSPSPVETQKPSPSPTTLLSDKAELGLRICPSASAHLSFAERAQAVANLLGPVELQKLIFTATNVQNFKGFRDLYLHEPISIQGTLTSEEQALLQQWFHRVPQGAFPGTLFDLLSHLCEDGGKVLIFCASAESCKSVKKSLEDILGNFPKKKAMRLEVLSGEHTTQERIRLMRKYRHDEVDVVISTDVASRGLHVEGIVAVIHADLPISGEVYVHRVGRTARAGAEGESIALVKSDREMKRLKKILREANAFRECAVQPFDDTRLIQSS